MKSEIHNNQRKLRTEFSNLKTKKGVNATMNSCQIIAIMNQKGGVAKTTTTINLAAALARKGFRVAVVDFDGQCSLTKLLGVKPGTYTDIGDHLERILDGQPDDPFEGLLAHDEGFDMVSGNLYMTSRPLTEGNNAKCLNSRLEDSATGYYTLRFYLDNLRDKYDYILIDTGPTVNMLFYNALAAADDAILVTLAEPASTDGINEFFTAFADVQALYHPDLRIRGILLTKANLRASLTRGIAGYLKAAYPEIPVFNTIIPNGITAAEAPMKRRSIFTYRKKSAVADAYEKFTEEVIAYG